MAWNEPGNQKPSDQDPWSGRNKKDGPPDLDELIKKIQQRLRQAFDNAGGPTGKNGSSFSNQNLGPSIVSFFALFVIFVLWLLSGFFVVQPAERAVILTFGKYSETLMPGLHWVPRLIESVYKVNVQQIYTYTFPPSEDTHMLTQDENIVSVAVTVQYRIDNAKDFLFNTASPIEGLKQATASAVRQVIGLYNLDDILTIGREQIRTQIESTLKTIISRYNLGIMISNVSIKSASAPEEVKEAFDDAIKAREDQQRIINQAQSYAMKVGPIAAGQAKQIIEIAKADAGKFVLEAQANTAEYLALLPQYELSPQVMRERLYLDAMENVLKNTSKILVDTGNNNNVLYLPIDKMMSSSKNDSASLSNNTETNTLQTLSTSTTANASSENTANNNPKFNIRMDRPIRLYDASGDQTPGVQSKGEINS